jgi:hypothetical protein
LFKKKMSFLPNAFFLKVADLAEIPTTKSEATRSRIAIRDIFVFLRGRLVSKEVECRVVEMLVFSEQALLSASLYVSQALNDRHVCEVLDNEAH